MVGEDAARLVNNASGDRPPGLGVSQMFLDQFEVEISAPAEAEARRRAPAPEPGGEIALLYLQHRGDLLRFCLRKLGNYEDASDVVQEAFCFLLKKPDPTSVQNPRAFLIETAKNLIRDKRRAEMRQKKKSHVALELVSDTDLVCPEPSAESRIQSRQAVGLALEALAELPEKCQAVFVMKLYYGFSYREIAAELDISSVVGVKKYMMRALGHLRESLDIDEIRIKSESANGVSINPSAVNGHSVIGHSVIGIVRKFPVAAE